MNWWRIIFWFLLLFIVILCLIAISERTKFDLGDSFTQELEYNELLKDIVEKNDLDRIKYLHKQQGYRFCVLCLLNGGTHTYISVLDDILKEACTQRNLKMIDTVFEYAQKKNVHICENIGLVGACAGGHIDVAEMMINKGANCFTAGLRASKSKEMADLILSTQSPNIDWEFALGDACRLDYREMAEMIVYEKNVRSSMNIYIDSFSLSRNMIVFLGTEEIIDWVDVAITRKNYDLVVWLMGDSDFCFGNDEDWVITPKHIISMMNYGIKKKYSGIHSERVNKRIDKHNKRCELVRDMLSIENVKLWDKNIVNYICEMIPIV